MLGDDPAARADAKALAQRDLSTAPSAAKAPKRHWSSDKRHRSERRGRAMKGGFNLSRWALRTHTADALPDRRAADRRHSQLHAPGPGRGPAVHLPRDGGARLLAGRDRAADGRAGHRQARTQAAGDARTSTRSAATPSRAKPLIILQLRESTPPKELPPPGTRCARRSATSAAPCRPACIGPFFNDEFGDTYGSIFALSGRRLHLRRGARTTPTSCASSCCACRRRQGRAVRRAGREDLHRVLAQEARPAGHPVRRRSSTQLAQAERGRVDRHRW